MRKRLEQTVTARTPGTIAAIRRGDDEWQGAAGRADTATGRLRTADEHFRIGSVTKVFTATVLLQLVAEGRIDLDDTSRRLLNHTSGIFDYTSDPGFVAGLTGPAFLTGRFRTYQPDELVAIAMAHPPAFAPGASWQYSNTNYVPAARHPRLRNSGRLPGGRRQRQQRRPRPDRLVRGPVQRGLHRTLKQGPAGRIIGAASPSFPGLQPPEGGRLQPGWTPNDM